MEVTNANFKELLPKVQKAIDTADFLSIDTEFTGLGQNDNRPNGLDVPEERYYKLRKGAMDFHIIQFGLSTFRFDADKKKYYTQVFNFYIFPRPFSRQAPDVRFSCQASSLDFLCSHGFDFNKLIKQGITYLRPDHEAKLRNFLQEKHDTMRSQQNLMTSPAFSSPSIDGSQLVKGPLTVPEEHQSFINHICEKIESFLGSTQEALSLPPCNGFLRKLTYQTVNIKFRSRLHLASKLGENRQRYIEVRRVAGKQEMERLEEAKRQAEIDELDEAVGFTNVINMISLSQKLVIGHNMLLDVLHLLHRFRCSLPESYEDFKSLTNCVFPRLLDTKVMATTNPLKDLIGSNSALGELLKTLETKPFEKPKIEFEADCPGYTSLTEQLHEAGYDAYITGLCYISMANYLGSQMDPAEEHVRVDSKILQPFLNKVHLMWVYDIPYINITGKDAPECRDHVFHLTFPADWRMPDLNQLFSIVGKISVTWIDDTSAFISLHNKDMAHMVMSQLSPGENYCIVPYSVYKENKAILSTPTSIGKPHKVPASDVQLPTKRKRNSDGASQFPSRHSITPIAEEDESTEEINNDNGVPVKRSKIEEGPASGEKLFQEPEKW